MKPKKKKPTYKEVYAKSKCKHLDLVDQKQKWGHKLSLSWDFDTDPNNRNQWKPVFLSIPNKSKSEHEHMVVSHKKARELRNWLNNFIKEVENYKRKQKQKSKAKKKA